MTAAPTISEVPGWASCALTTTGQLRLFATALREGSWNGARIDHALPDRKPARRPDVRQRRVPVGPVAVFAASNFPLAFSVAGGDTASALAAGCPVVIKGHEAHPLTSVKCAAALKRGAAAAGQSADVVSLVLGRAAGADLVRDPGIDKISFTGSTAAGRRIAGICAERVARVNLELGGKSAALILDDYDIGTAAASLAESATELTGQVCSALTRVIVTKNRHDELVEALSAEFAKVRVGDPFDANSDMGPVAMKRQLDKICGLLEAGREEGAVVAAGGRRPAGLDVGWFIEPTVFGNVDNHSTIARNEIFGPVLTVIPAESEQDQITIANDSIYGLNSAVFTNDEDRAWAFARQIRSGTVGHNAHRNSHAFAFGGFKQSGIGREGGREGLLPYLETKAIILNREPTTYAPDTSPSN